MSDVKGVPVCVVGEKFAGVGGKFCQKIRMFQ